jgi:hypothetical protein
MVCSETGSVKEKTLTMADGETLMMDQEIDRRHKILGPLRKACRKFTTLGLR